MEVKYTICNAVCLWCHKKKKNSCYWLKPTSATETWRILSYLDNTDYQAYVQYSASEPKSTNSSAYSIISSKIKLINIVNIQIYNAVHQKLFLRHKNNADPLEIMLGSIRSPIKTPEWSKIRWLSTLKHVKGKLDCLRLFSSNSQSLLVKCEGLQVQYSGILSSDSHLTCYKVDSFNLWSFRGQNLTIVEHLFVLNYYFISDTMWLWSSVWCAGLAIQGYCFKLLHTLGELRMQH